MDRRGETIIRTAVSEEHFNEHGYNGFSKDNKANTKASFTSKSGTVQGDVDSPNKWKRAFDILLTALRLGVPEGKFYLRNGSSLYSSHGVGFVDDLVSIVGTGTALQKTADIVCAFCAIFGMLIAPEKLRTFQVNFGNETDPEYDIDELKVHHGVLWEQDLVQVAHSGQMKYLGVIFDIDRGGDFFKTTYDMLIMKSRIVCNILATRNASATLKILVAQISTMASIKYAAKVANWRLSQYRKLDGAFSKLFRSALHHRFTVPTELIYGPRLLCGAGLRRFSDICQRERWSQSQRFIDKRSPSYTWRILVEWTTGR
jgi:hypothetical protein